MKRLTWYGWVAVALAAAGLVVMARLWSTDVWVPVTGLDSGPSFCGSAWDVVLAKKSGSMGGERPLNQDAIDRACHEASLDPVQHGAVVGAAGIALAALVAGGGAGASRGHNRRVPPALRPEVPRS